MDLNTVTSVDQPRRRDDLDRFAEGDAWLAGGTWLFSEPQPKLRRLIDLAGFNWQPLTVGDGGLSIAATCTIAQLDAFQPPAAWTAAALIGPCCRAFAASFKVWNMATVGGNLCMALPAGPMIALSVALDGTCVIWTPQGGERRLPAIDFVSGPSSNALRPGEMLRAIEFPDEALRRRTAFRRASLTPLGRSGALVIGMLGGDDSFALTITASTIRPVRVAFPSIPGAADLLGRLDVEVPQAMYFADVHGDPHWRRHMTCELADEIRRELGGRR